MSDAMGAEPPFGVSLRLTDEKPPALHHGGFIDYGAAGGSYYYSRTRLSVVGGIAQGDGEPVPVSGIAWMDHQWGDFVVAAAGGWDWYSVQLDDGSELPYDLFLGVPKHRAPAVVEASGLTENGWVSVNPRTLFDRK